jgi:hypothetical protein
MAKHIVPDEVLGWDLAREVVREVVAGAAAQPRRQANIWAAATMVSVVVLASLHAPQMAYVAVLGADIIALLPRPQRRTERQKSAKKGQRV